jgi:hypothetical protein
MVDAPSNQSFELASGLLFAGAILWFMLGHSITTAVKGPSTPEEIVAELTPPKGKPMVQDANWRAWLEDWVRRIRMVSDDLGANPCTERTRDDLRTQVNNYFERIREFEDWKPGQELSRPSKNLIDIVKINLHRGTLSWERLKPYTQIHLDAQQFGGPNAVKFAPKCS